jgi:hypothetical protein
MLNIDIKFLFDNFWDCVPLDVDGNYWLGNSGLDSHYLFFLEICYEVISIFTWQPGLLIPYSDRTVHISIDGITLQGIVFKYLQDFLGGNLNKRRPPEHGVVYEKTVMKRFFKK